MHSMTQGATGLRERRAEQTAHGLSTTARRLAAEHGLGGFTVEQACAEVGVSRRTFFNYFASKEDAVLGRSIRRGDDDAVTTFLAGGTAVGALSATLLDDLVALYAARWEALGFTRDTMAEVRAALEREPRLLSRLLEGAKEDQAADVALVARREGLAPDDVRAATAVHLIGALAKASASEYLEAEPDGALAPTFAEVLAARLAVARTLLGARP
jgi:AcrR family transcriptional regulator